MRSMTAGRGSLGKLCSKSDLALAATVNIIALLFSRKLNATVVSCFI